MKKKQLDHQELIMRANRQLYNDEKKVSNDPHRLGYHIMAPANWMNDPNGLIHFNGEYHVFYQHHPYSPEWGPMHWGHVKSKDLVHWEHLPIALAPSEEYDKDGCFSGSAVNDNGVLTLIYTGHVENREPKQVQCIATSLDGVTFKKYEGNPVISGPPIDGSSDFRDPKVWKHDNIWYMVVGSGKDGKGKALLYSSTDLRNWDYIGPVAESDGTQGYMWECPDLFPLGDKYILIVSPMGMKNRKNIYIVGEMDYETGRFKQEFYDEVDYGFDFYAAQTFIDDNGRRIMIGWMNMWNTHIPTKAKGWAGALTIPRELSLLPDGKLSIQPIPELKKLRRNHHQIKDIVISTSTCNELSNFQGDCLEILAEFDLDTCDATEFGIKVRCSIDYKQETLVIYNTLDKKLKVDRNKSGYGDGGVSECLLEIPSGNTLKLHLFLDRSSLEVFGNEGRVVMTNRIYPDPTSLGLDLFARNGSVRLVSLDIWDLKPIW